MTNLEALQAETAGLNIPDSTLEYQLAKQGLKATDEYKGGKAFDLSVAWSLVYAFRNPKSWSQGDMSETWDWDILKKLIAYYFNKYGEDNPLSEITEKPTIQDVSYLH